MTTKIQWTEDVWNPVVGCSVVSPGCTNCYAMRAAWRLSRNPKTPHYAGTVKQVNGKPVWTGKIGQAGDQALTAPLRRRKPTTWFVNSMGDLFHESIPDEVIDRVFAVMALCPQHQFQVLTKRAARMRAYMNGCDGSTENIAYGVLTSWHRRSGVMQAIGNVAALVGYRVELGKIRHLPLPNVWLGVSAEDQRRADERIPLLLDTPAAVRFISAEPLLGPIDIGRWLAIDWRCSYCREYFSGRHKSHCPNCGKEGGWCGSHAFNGRHYPDGPISPSQRGSGLDWIICGGESGAGARPMDLDWARSIVAQCKAASVPVFYKQGGASNACPHDKKGGHFECFPADLQVRQMPHGQESEGSLFR
jgi:protein gp37